MTITAAVVLSRSANGILIGAMVWVYFLWRTFKEKITVKKVFAFFFVVAGIILFLSTTDFFEKALYRVETVAVRDAATTGNGRLLQGLAVYARLSPFEKVIGLGLGMWGHISLRTE